MKKLLLCLVLASFCVISPATAQVSKSGNHLLWRISGKGLKTSSYLFGTIHLRDKRVFNFGDSLYAAIEKSEGYAMELNPDSIMIDYFEGKDDEAAGILVKNVADKKLYDKAKKKLSEKLGKPADKVTVKELREYNTEWVNKNADGSMGSFMDAYLYNVARKAGKWVGGIEDVEDQKGDRDDEPVEFYLNELLNDNRQTRKVIEEMIRIYQAENLADLETFMNSSSHFSIDTVLIRRNIKMARRIDSLSALRNTFFAIGAAHLPGDSGVINLLRKRGFAVEPVVSSKRIAASTYKFPEKELPWVTVSSKTELYTAQFPGEPQNNYADFENMDMQIYGDIGSNLFYFTMGVLSEQIKNEDSLYEKVLTNMGRKSTIISKKPFEQQGVRGQEVLAKSGEATYRIRVFYKNPAAYVAMVGSQVEETLKSNDAERFFSSFRMNTEKKLVVDKTWNKYQDDQKAFAIEFPGKATIKRNQKEREEGFLTDQYTLLDLSNIIYYSVIVKDADKGVYIDRDSSAFTDYIKTIEDGGTVKVLSSQIHKFDGYPALSVRFRTEDDGDITFSRVLYMHRGNRMYILIAVVQDTIKTKEQSDRFFSSFRLMPLKEREWKVRVDSLKTFSAWSPASFKLLKDSSLDEGIQYEIYDSLSPTTLYVMKIPYSKYFWTKDDTTQLRKEAKARLHYGDSLIDYKLVNNGNYKGAEALMKLKDNHNLKKFRFIIVGDTLYVLYSIVMKEVLELKNYKRFFEEFKFTNEKAVSTIFKSKAESFLAELASADSAKLETLSEVLDELTFEEKDLPLLHSALLKTYADSGSYSNVSQKLFNIVGDLRSKTTVEFVKKAYRELPESKEYLRYNLLYLIAAQKDLNSYKLIPELIKFKQPTAENAYVFLNELRDTLLLSKEIFPDLLPLLKDSVAWRHVVFFANDLLDSNIIKKTALDGYLNEINQIAARGSKAVNKKDFDDSYYYYPIIELLGYLKTKEAEQWLRKFLTSPDPFVKYEVASILLENNLAVSAAELLKIAANNGYRITLYDRLKELKKESLFPLTYKTQKAFAESGLYNLVVDEYDMSVDKIAFVGERTVSYKGKKQTFYLYKLTIDGGDGPENKLGIVGPFSAKSTKLLTESDVAGIYEDEEFSTSKLDSHLKAFLTQIEKREELD